MPVDKRDVMPDRIRAWLNARGISDQTIKDYGLYYDEAKQRIAIPIRDEDNVFAYNKYRRDPDLQEGPKYMYDRGGRALLFGAGRLWREGPVIICEGEFDCMLLDSKGFVAVTSTGGAFTFRPEWVKLLEGREVYVCLDNDDAGRAGTMRIASMIPEAKVMVLPGLEIKGDITDFFKEHDANDFRFAMTFAERLPPPPPPTKIKPKARGTDLERAKSVPLSNYIKIDPNGARLVKCPFHTDGTASFKWYKKDNRWWCFGGCGGGDVVDFVMKQEGVDLRTAVQRILG